MNANAVEFDAVIVGGGFFGCSVATHLARELGERTIVLERGSDALQRASYANQARVHNGYHYPRSVLTAFRCRVNFPRFVDDFPGCIMDTHEKYYGVGKRFSKVNAVQFKRFCELIGAPVSPAPKDIKRLFNLDYVDDVFSTREYIFDAVKLKNETLDRARNAGVEIRFNTEATCVRRSDDGSMELEANGPDGAYTLTTRSVYNCTYARLNKLLHNSGLPTLFLKHELTEMALVEVPDVIANRGITMMCGPFFSIMPFPARGLHTLSHVRYTPHCEWFDRKNEPYRDPYEYIETCDKTSNYVYMVKDAERYIPCLRECRYQDSIWEVKTVLPKSEVDDSRPVLYQKDWGLPNLTCMMGGKIDNIYDIMDFLTPARV